MGRNSSIQNNRKNMQNRLLTGLDISTGMAPHIHTLECVQHAPETSEPTGHTRAATSHGLKSQAKEKRNRIPDNQPNRCNS